MSNTLLTTGLTCIVAAIIGGGLKAFGIDVPVLVSVKRQVLLGIFGLVLVWAGASSSPPDKPTASGTVSPSADQSLTPVERERLLAELHDNNERISHLQLDMGRHAAQYPEQEENISHLEGQVNRGEGTPAEIAAAEVAIKEARRVMKEAHEADAVAAEVIGRATQRNREIEAILRKDKANQ